jgi:hypothetical protein
MNAPVSANENAAHDTLKELSFADAKDFDLKREKRQY